MFSREKNVQCESWSHFHWKTRFSQHLVSSVRNGDRQSVLDLQQTNVLRFTNVLILHKHVDQFSVIHLDVMLSFQLLDRLLMGLRSFTFLDSGP